MLTQDHRTDGREWNALSAVLSDLTAVLKAELKAEPPKRDRDDFEYFKYIISKVRNPCVRDLKMIIEILSIFHNNFDVPEKFSTLHNLMHMLRRDGDYTPVQMLTPDTLEVRRMLYNRDDPMQLNKVDGHSLWSDIMHYRPHDATRLIEIVIERNLSDFHTATALLDEMDNHHDALMIGAL